jgi:hypothetical protein
MPIINMVYKKKKGWKPWANTIAYYKFENNLNDSSGNGRDLSMYTWSFSFSTLSSWQPYCQLNTSAEATFSNMPFSRTAYTISGFCLWDSTDNTYQKIILDLISWDNYFPRFYTWWGSNVNKISSVVSFDGYWDTFAANTRFHLVTVYDNNVVKSYINWILIHSLTYSNASTTWTLYLNWTSNYNANYRTNWKISELILENKARSETEITKYLNSMKDIYWIS